LENSNYWRRIPFQSLCLSGILKFLVALFLPQASARFAGSVFDPASDGRVDFSALAPAVPDLRLLAIVFDIPDQANWSQK
jgi:hypothetical protein